MEAEKRFPELVLHFSLHHTISFFQEGKGSRHFQLLKAVAKAIWGEYEYFGPSFMQKKWNVLNKSLASVPSPQCFFPF